MSSSFRFLCIGSVSLAFVACGGSDSEVYGSAVASELNRTDRVDTLLGGLSFAMTREQFFEYCMAAQKRGEMRQGTGLTVRMDVPAEQMPGLSLVEFYPTYSDANQIATLPGRIYAQQWSPWNQELSADSLTQAALAYLQSTLGGNSFEKVAGAPRTTFVKLDANRRAEVRPSEEQMIEFTIVDLAGVTDSVRLGRDLLVPQNNVAYPVSQRFTRGN